MASRDLRLLGPGKARRSDRSGLLPCRTPIGLSSGQGASLRAQLRLNKSIRNTSSPANLFGQGARVRPLTEDVYAGFQTNLWVMTPHSHQHQHSCPGVLPGIPLLQGVPPGHSNLKMRPDPAASHLLPPGQKSPGLHEILPPQLEVICDSSLSALPSLWQPQILT